MQQPANRLTSFFFCIVALALWSSAGAQTEPSANQEPSAHKEPSATQEPSADKEPSANQAQEQAPAPVVHQRPASQIPPPEPTSDLVPSSLETYKTVGTQELKAHIFYPEETSDDSQHPAILFFHGGALRFGSPIHGYAQSEIFNPLGVVVISVEYRLLGKGETLTLDEIIGDAKSAVRWTRANAERLHIDPNKITVSGHSSGSYLAYTTGTFTAFDDPSEDLAISSVPNAMVLWSLNTLRTERDTAPILPAGHTIDDFQPSTYLSDAMPPSVFIHGAKDDIIDYHPTLDFEKKMEAAGNQTSFVLVDEADHFFRTDELQETAFSEMIKLMEQLGFIE